MINKPMKVNNLRIISEYFLIIFLVKLNIQIILSFEIKLYFLKSILEILKKYLLYLFKIIVSYFLK